MKLSKSKIVHLHAVVFKNEPVLTIKCAYNKDMDRIVRSLPNRQWSQTLRAWYIPNTSEQLRSIFQAFKGVAEVRCHNDQPAPPERKSNRSFLFKQKFTQKFRAMVNHDTLENIEEYKRFLAVRQYSASSIKTYVSMITTFLGYLKNKSPETIMKSDIDRYKKDVVSAGGHSISYQRQFIGSIKLFFTRFPSPFLDIKTLEWPAKQKKIPIILTPDETNRLLDHVTNLKHRALVAVLAHTGLRVSETLALLEIDLNRSNSSIRVDRPKHKEVFIKVPQEVMMLLREYHTEYKPKVYLFNGQNKLKYSQVSVRAILSKAAKEAGIRKKVTPQTLRHSFASNLINTGTSIAELQILLGHSKPESTLMYNQIAANQFPRPYELTPEHIREAAEGPQAPFPSTKSKNDGPQPNEESGDP